MPTRVALIAHDHKKDDIVTLAGEYADTLRRCELIATGTTGTFACRAIISKPRLMRMSWPVREICPSGNTHTSSPACSARIAARMPSVGLWAEIRIVPLSRRKHSKYQCRDSP